MGLFGALKDVGRSVPGVNTAFGLSSPEDIAAQRQKRGLTQAGEQLTPAFEQASQSFAPIAGLAGGLTDLQQRTQAGGFTPQFTPGQNQFNQTQLPGQEQFNFDLQADPSFQFAQQQGLQGVRDQFAGSGLKGRELQELAQFSTGLASQYAPQMRQQAFNEFQQQQGQGLDLARLGITQDQLTLEAQRLGLTEQELAAQLGQQQFNQELSLGQIGIGGLGAQAGFDTDLAMQQSNLMQQKGQVGAAQAMGNAGQIRGLLNEGFKASGFGADAGGNV